MRRNVRDRVAALAPFLTYDSDPYIVVGDDGRLSWIMDAFTTSDSYPYSSHYALGNTLINYMRNSVKVVIDAYDGTTTFYVFDPQDPIITAYRQIFPALFKDAAAMPPALRKHVRYPELLLKLQAAVYGLYHMTDPQVFYNREDLWTVASEVGMDESGQQKTQSMEPNFVLMKLPGETAVEFVEILPFTPANRNNLIGWIAGRSDGEKYGTSVVYDFPKTKTRRRPSANRGANRSERAAVGTIDAVESARFPRAARHSAGDSVRARAVVCGTDLPAGRAQSDAGVASGGARAAGPARLWSDLRLGDEGSVWGRGLVAKRHNCPCGTGTKCRVVGRLDQTRCGLEHAHHGSGQRPRRLPATNGGGQARGGWAETRTAKAQARRTECASKVICSLKSSPEPWSSFPETPFGISFKIADLETSCQTSDFTYLAAFSSARWRCRCR